MTTKTLQPHDLAAYGLPDAIFGVAPDRLASEHMHNNPRVVEFLDDAMPLFPLEATELLRCNCCKKWLHPLAFSLDSTRRGKRKRRYICRKCDAAKRKDRELRAWVNGFKRKDKSGTLANA